MKLLRLSQLFLKKIYSQLELLFSNSQQFIISKYMGNLCDYKHQEPVVYSSGVKPKEIKANINQTQNQRLAEIRQFLTLTSQNTQSCCLGEVKQRTISKNHVFCEKGKQITDFQVLRGLGRGAFGQVYMVKDREDNKLYAMKIIPKQRITNQQEKIHTLSQRYILEAMDHPFIVKLHFAFQTTNKLYLLVDMMSGGQLFYLLRRNGKFKQQVAKFYLAEILLALQYLHSRNIIYRDLKPQNILLDRDGHIKLTDFGLSKVCYSSNQLAYSVCGTPQYIAPEIVQGKGYNQSADWFSFGSLIYDMLTGKPPFYSKNKHQMLKKIATKPIPIPQNLSPNARSLLTGLFKMKPKDRLGFKNGAQQIKNHDFFKDIDFKEILARNIKPPMTFQEAQINQQGFEDNLGYQSLLFDEKTLREKGIAFDGFTYHKQDLTSPTDIAAKGKDDNKHSQQNLDNSINEMN